ncbi:Uncharacterized protein APZ42_000709, partial [Daphnia magna]
ATPHVTFREPRSLRKCCTKRILTGKDTLLHRARIKCGRGPRTADRRNCGLSPADWPKIFEAALGDSPKPILYCSLLVVEKRYGKIHSISQRQSHR